MKHKVFTVVFLLFNYSFISAQTVENDSCNIWERTSAISTVDSEQLMKSSALNLRNALFGNVLGLSSIQGSGSIWDEKTSFSIRGLQSFSNNGVLILVDGFERPIDEITVEEVENVSILKDAAAVALYGYKGVNGVILVTTKRGKYNERKINISYEHGFHQPMYLPDFADSYTYANAINEAYVNDGKMPRYNQFELDAFRNGTYPDLYPNVNWVDEVIGDLAHSNIYNISFRGGGDKMRYYTMFNLENSSGFFRNTDNNEGYSNQNEYSKANIRTNLDIDLSSTTKVQVNLLGILVEYNHSSPNQIMDNIYTLPSAAYPVKTEEGIWGGNVTWPGINPVANLQAKGYSRSHSRTLMADMKLSQELNFITPGLNASIRLGYDNQSTFWESRAKSYKYASESVLFDNGIPSELLKYEAGQDKELTFTKNMNGPMYYRFNFEGLVDYKKNFSDSKIYTSLSWRFFRDVQNDRNNTLNQQYLTSYTHYGYKDRYFADLALVMSGSNRLPSGNKFAFSPTISLAWNINNETFLKDISWLDLLKLRASAGILYSDYVPEWNMTSQNFVSGGGYWFTDNYTPYGGMTEGRLPVSNFKHERAIKYNLGIDAGFFNSLSFTGDVYYQRRDQQMVAAGGITSNALGVLPSYLPMGIVDSYGAELGLDYKKQIGDMVINAGARFNFTRNEIIENLETPVPYDYLSKKGCPVNQPFGLEAIGFFKDEQDIMDSPKQLFSEVKPGDIKYNDRNKDGFIDENDMVAMGYNTSVPEIYYGFNLGFEYKGFGIYALFQGIGHKSVWLDTKSIYRPLVNNTTISNYYYENRWTEDNQNAKFPRLTSEANANNNQNSSLWLADASFLKLRNCEVYYKLPLSLVSKAKMKAVKIYLRGMDLFSFDKMELTDPEVVGVSYPVDRSFHVGARIDF